MVFWATADHAAGRQESMKPVTLRIQGHEYSIRSDGTEEEILRIAEYVNAKIIEAESSGQGLSEKKTVVLAALSIASDYFQALKEKEIAVSGRRKQAETMIRHIDSIME
jgi:cell division protein ZapA (FtsZ GTPase activity inhibitor)